MGKGSAVAPGEKQGKTWERVSVEKRHCQVNEKNHHISEDLEAEKLTCAPRTWEGKEGGSQYKEELLSRQTTHDGVVSSGRPGFLAALQEMPQREGGLQAERPAPSLAGCGTAQIT